MFEEQGWEGDLLYPARPNRPRDICSSEESLNNSPKNQKNPDNTTHPCSLHHLLRSRLGTETSCNSSSLTSLTKQAVLCEGQSALNVVLHHSDLEGLEAQDLCGNCLGKQNGGYGAPPVMQLEVVREPTAKVILEKINKSYNFSSFRWSLPWRPPP